MIRPLLCLALLGMVACELTQEQSKIPSSSSSLSSSLESSSSSLRTAAYSSPLEIAVQKDSLVDARDGQHYAVLRIGTQTWMAENLRYDAPLGVDSLIPNLGRKYNGYAIFGADSTHESTTNPSNYVSICPQGWHLPSLAEWLEMIEYVDLRDGEQALKVSLSSEPYPLLSSQNYFYWLSDFSYPYSHKRAAFNPSEGGNGVGLFAYSQEMDMFSFIRCAKDLP